MKKIISVFVLFCPMLLFGQTLKDEYPLFKRAYTSEYWLQTVSEFGYTELILKDESEFYETEATYSYFNLAAIELEQKLRLLQYQDFLSISISAIESVQFRVISDRNSEQVALNLGISPFIDFNFFNHATYNSNHRFGFFVGIGPRYGTFITTLQNVSAQNSFSPRIRVGVNQTLSFTDYHHLTMSFYFGLRDNKAAETYDLLGTPNDFFGIAFQYRRQHSNNPFY